MKKEEQKQHIIEMMQDDEKLGLYGANIIDTWLEKNGDPEISKQVEKEAEELILEEAGIEHCNLIDNYPQLENPLFSFKAGANWMAERMYSEEEVKAILFHRESHYIKTGHHLHINEWFEQFKK